MKPFFALNPEEAQALVLEGGGQAFQARSIQDWILRRGVLDFDRMSDLSKPLREFLKSRSSPLSSRERERKQAPDSTVKLLIELQDKETIETVVMPGTHGHTICISTQVGCPVACVFCASGSAGLVRNLEWWEIVEQFLLGRALYPFQRAVIMGIGEPTLNMQNLVQALSVITDAKGFGLGARRITISTVGYPDRVIQLAESGKPYNLAVSLHAPDDTLREQIIPTMKKVSLDEIIQAANLYFEKTGREVTFEYVLLAGVNDLPQHAEALARKLRGTRSTVNLIPYNPVSIFKYKRPSASHVEIFSNILRRAHIPTTVRWSKGLEADAACGQLRILAKSEK